MKRNKKGNKFRNIIFQLFLYGFIWLSASVIYTTSYKLTKRLIFICYFWILYKIIIWIVKWQKEPDKKWYPGEYKTKRWAIILCIVLWILWCLTYAYLFWSWIIDNIATTIAERLSQNLHMEWWKTPRIGSSQNN